MGGSMSKIVPGLYVGGVASAQSKSQLDENGITHVCSVLHYNFKCPSRKQIILRADDDSKENIAKYFRDACFFIHEARVYNGAVLVHCACGVSRSVTITLAYLMTVTNMPLPKLVRAVVGARPCACPNSGFLEQLIEFGKSGAAAKVRQELIAYYGEWPKEKLDADIAHLTELLLRPEHSTCIGASGGFALPDDVAENTDITNSQESLDINLDQRNMQTSNMKPSSYTIYLDKPLHMQKILSENDDTNPVSSSSL
ncbi:Dual specificity protein phosphatase 22 [Schistosoma japonicum]|uniref:Dual specificity protein phosphatase 22 n=1 Tax=Schistosoma japonicum TaxID=6182 RepID=Q5DGN0_SCHJA|nr:SJCHGC01353 protein [Schistosoma japonicum]KAH8873968.1 Dual specificity protein phosphatase 22 [Schistosoma japonicum]TNN15793.1 Dual specificity protein phosphatase 22 [Schistosoma japonicum]TNN15794.1 Dual specificity protein phosphatase 22 [Schistosoma japonicum]